MTKVGKDPPQEVRLKSNLPSTPKLIDYGFRKIYPWGSNSCSVILITV